MKLNEINQFYLNVAVDNLWANVSKHSDPILWNLLTSDDINEINVKCETHSDEEMKGNNAKQNDECVTMLMKIRLFCPFCVIPVILIFSLYSKKMVLLFSI